MTETGLQSETLDLDPPEVAPANVLGRDLMSKFDGLIAERQALIDTGVTDPFAIVMDRVLSPTEAIIGNRHAILLGTYNYMGMTFDPDVIEAGKQALSDFGSGTTGSRVLNGTYRGHRECEDALRDFYDMDEGLRRWFWAMPWGERYIWGVTAGILKGLHARLYGDEAAPIAAAEEDAA